MSREVWSAPCRRPSKEFVAAPGHHPSQIWHPGLTGDAGYRCDPVVRGVTGGDAPGCPAVRAKARPTGDPVRLSRGADRTAHGSRGRRPQHLIGALCAGARRAECRRRPARRLKRIPTGGDDRRQCRARGRCDHSARGAVGRRLAGVARDPARRGRAPGVADAGSRLGARRLRGCRLPHDRDRRLGGPGPAAKGPIAVAVGSSASSISGEAPSEPTHRARIPRITCWE